MSNLEGDGIMELMYYLLWRKDSPYKLHLNISIPDTIIFKKGKPVRWYFTNSEGTVLQKKIENINFENIISKFLKGAKPNEIVGYFIRMELERDNNLNKLMKKIESQQANKPVKEDDEDDSAHRIEYFDKDEFIKKFDKGAGCTDMEGVLQRFIEPYGAHNEMIQAIWSPRVCVFTKQVNLRKLKEHKFDVYERALTFDGPAYYSKNVPLRGGYIPGKLRATCDMIVQHISHVSFEKTNINRLVAYFKVDKKENVWFLWSTSIRVKETSKIHRQTSAFLDRPLTLEPMLKTSENIRLAQTYLSNRPAHLQMNEFCTICGKCVTNGQLVPVQYKYLLGNDEILRRSEKYYTKNGEFIDHSRPPDADEMIMMDDTPEEGRPIQIKKSLIGVPVFIKAFHPELTLKEYQVLREKEHFLMQKTNVCDECFLVVSKKYQGGYPYNFTVPTPAQKPIIIPVQKYIQESSLEPVFKSGKSRSNVDGIIEETSEGRTLNTQNEELNPRMNVKMNIDIEPDYFSQKPHTASTTTGRNASKSLSRGFRNNNSSQFFSPTTTNTPGGTRPISTQNLKRRNDSKEQFEDDEDYETAEYRFTNLRTEIVKLLSGEEPKPLRIIKSASGATHKRPASLSMSNQPITEFNIRPATTSGNRKLGNDVIKSAYAQRKPRKKDYELKVNDIFEESSFENNDLEENLLKNDLNRIRQSEPQESSRIREEFKKAELIRELENANKVEVYDKQFQINSELTSPASHTGRLPGKNTPKKEKNMLVRNPSAGSNSSNVFMKKNFQILNEFGDIKSSGKFPKTTKNAQKKETLDDYIEKMINDKGIDPKYLAKAKSKLSSIEADINQKYQSVKNQYNKELNLKEIFN